MTMTDSIADMFTRIRNGLQAKKATIDVPASTMKRSVLDVLQSEGYIIGYGDVADAKHPTIRVELKYHAGSPVISEIKRVSRPGLRKYSSAKEIPLVRGGLGIGIVSTSRGVISDAKAREFNVGGELIGQVF